MNDLILVLSADNYNIFLLRRSKIQLNNSVQNFVDTFLNVFFNGMLPFGINLKVPATVIFLAIARSY